MRRYAFPFSVILLFFIMLSFPQEVFDGASEGLLLWFQIVLPTLLPFIIISNILIQTNSISLLSHIFGPAFRKSSVFQLTEALWYLQDFSVVIRWALK